MFAGLLKEQHRAMSQNHRINVNYPTWYTGGVAYVKTEDEGNARAFTRIAISSKIHWKTNYKRTGMA